MALTLLLLPFAGHGPARAYLGLAAHTTLAFPSLTVSVSLYTCAVLRLGGR
ncbi:hypothetical protein [Streptomyces sp. NBC_01216]|uniref:hypothetical protein n=1 Tax=unclassified Streptomyces TaxID=2593676 RepID=UPI002E0FF425|nr:hypothetical protein OG393_26575 [Streptomyces sp. NBC_01216]